ncbi:MAG: phytoene desaturase [Cryomorphaceae bacterium]|nr:MAG: phytoene desaturase [Cryomorphaceae bacterium]
MKIAVIGAGIGGLGAAIRLRLNGHEVTVFEANSYAGGKLTDIVVGGYRFDAGPSLFTMPENVTDLFTDAGKNPDDYFRYKRVGESCRYFYPDGTHFIAYDNPERFAQECEKVLGVPKKKVRDYLAHSERLFNLTADLFMKNSLHKLRTYLSFDTFRSFLQIHKLELTKTMNRANEDRLGHPKLVQLFNRFATYNGSNPYIAPGVLNIIPHLEMSIGTFFPEGGMASISRSTEKLARELGVAFEFNSPVEQILIEQNTAMGVRVHGENRLFDRVVSNMDVVPTYRRLMPNQPAPERTLRQDRSTSAVIFYWGIRKNFDNLGLQNIFFSDNYREEFRFLNEVKNISDDPTVYLHISSVLESYDAPPGCMNWYILVNAPHNTGQNWDEIIARTRKNVISRLSKELGEDIEPLIEAEDFLDPRRIEMRTSSYQGSLYGASSNGLFNSFIRHPNFSQRVKGLYFCGGSVHPGGGIPLCLLSGKIVADLIK